MMHDREKSDPAVVAAKPTNNVSVSKTVAAEPVERHGEAMRSAWAAGTKRNTDGRSTHRAQDRARVSQALDRVRQAARQQNKEKFTALFHHLSVDLLRESFLALKRNAAPGVAQPGSFGAVERAATCPGAPWTGWRHGPWRRVRSELATVPGPAGASRRVLHGRKFRTTQRADMVLHRRARPTSRTFPGLCVGRRGPSWTVGGDTRGEVVDWE